MRVYLTRLFYDFAMSRVWKNKTAGNIEYSTLQVSARDEHKIPVRIYKHRDSGTEKRPVIIYYHGGGFVIGSLKGYHNFLMALAEMNNAVVISMDYRLAPENPYPTPLNDASDVTSWIFKNASDLGIADKFILAGDSAGGNLAAVLSHKFKNNYAEQIKGQLLICPVTDRHIPAKGSLLENAKIGPLTAKVFNWFTNLYTKNGVDPEDVGIYPIKNSDFTNLPPALVFTAQLDVLRDDGFDYARKLQQVGIATTHIHQNDEVHNFPIGRNRTDNSEALKKMQDWIAQRFSGNGL